MRINDRRVGAYQVVRAIVGEPGCNCDATKCRVEPGERPDKDGRAALTSQGWRGVAQAGQPPERRDMEVPAG